eukprot:1658672-Prymnesium_polylepis.1
MQYPAVLLFENSKTFASLRVDCSLREGLVFPASTGLNRNTNVLLGDSERLHRARGPCDGDAYHPLVA